MSTDLQTIDGIARVYVAVGPDSPVGWSATLAVAAPLRYDLEPVAAARVGDEWRLSFAVSDALLGKPYDLVITHADGDQSTVASGTITQGEDPLRVDLPADFDTPTITVSDTPPADPDEGDLWVDTTAPTIFVGNAEPEAPEVGDIWFDTSTT